MQLKKLQLAGFKTFADKTDIEFSDGITAVVGPNGCGKSNVGDALLWVMGEQNPRLLRGSESRDVIFSGTDRRKPLGMAEVRLTLDNADRALPIEFAEVTVTRRVYRSGESQYLLNNAPCRLKDIVELFLDTGIGKGAYSFVSQSEIDAVLSARPEDRRELFEEAAGIKKYRVKKREAVRKLEHAEANLQRIRDIVRELEDQRAPLERQAEQARRYLQLTERLQQIEVDLLVADAKKADYELYAHRHGLELSRAAVQDMDAALGRMEREADAVRDRLAEAEHELEAARVAHQAALSAVERTESALQLAEERGRSAEVSAQGLEAELGELAGRIGELEREAVEQVRALAVIAARLGERGELRQAARARVAALDAAVAEAQARADDRQGMVRRLAEERAQREAALAACRSRMDEAAARATRLDADHTQLQAQAAEAREREGSAREQRDAVRRSAEKAAEAHSVLVAQRRAAQDRLAVARTDLEAARRLLAERASRLSTLIELQESGEGFYQGVRAVLTAARKGLLAGGGRSYAPVVDLLSVPERLRVAIEVALGASAQDIVCDTEAEARAAIEHLKATRAGRATFLALPMLRPSAGLAAAALRGCEGLEGVAAALVSADARYAPVLQLLLGRVVIARDMDAAMRACRRVEGWGRIVTLEGELLTPGGALTGGSLQGRGAHLVGRKGEIDDLGRVVPRLRADADQLAQAVEESGAEAARLDTAIAGAAGDAADAQARHAAAERDLHAAEREAVRLAGSVADAAAEIARVAGERTALEAEAARWEKEVEAGRLADTTADDAITEARDAAAALAVQRDEARQQAVALEVEAGREAEKHAALERELAGSRSALETARRSHVQKSAQREQSGDQSTQARAAQYDLAARLEATREHLADTDARHAHWRDRRQVLLAESYEKAAAIKETVGQRGAAMEQIHDDELQIARLEVRLAQTEQRLNDEYGITLPEALGRPEVGEIPRDTVNEIARLRREVRAMGQVNTGAVDEYQRLTERHDFLDGQRADLTQARESLLATIAEIDASTQTTFMETFDQVAAEFGAIFHRLFGGGTTRLVLTDPDDLLETGIEIMAQPPGKKPQHLSLLSGGERALTAVALLFAFLAVRPSPFVLLDEVDAPLDGANVDKFVHLVRDFSERTQFLIITHNPTTMEAAPRWYGVTMQEAGVSRILSYRVPQDTIPSEPETAVVFATAAEAVNPLAP